MYLSPNLFGSFLGEYFSILLLTRECETSFGLDSPELSEPSSVFIVFEFCEMVSEFDCLSIVECLISIVF